MTLGYDRRRFLQFAGTGATASIAGCTDIGLVSDDGDDGDDERLTAVVDAPQAEIQELYEQLEAGEIDQSELQAEAQQLRSDAIEEFEAYADDEDVTIEESSDDVDGLYLIDGADEAILGALRSGPLTVLYGSEAYEIIIEQQQQQQQPTDPEQTPGDDADDGDAATGEGGGNENETAGENGDEDGEDTTDGDDANANDS